MTKTTKGDYFNLFQIATNNHNYSSELDNFVETAYNLSYSKYYISFGIVDNQETIFYNSSKSGIQSVLSLRHFHNAFWNAEISGLAITLENGETSASHTSLVFYTDGEKRDGIRTYKIKEKYLEEIFFNPNFYSETMLTNTVLLAFAELATELDWSLDEFQENYKKVIKNNCK